MGDDQPRAHRQLSDSQTRPRGRPSAMTRSRTRTPASASQMGQRKMKASGKAKRGNASASARAARPASSLMRRASMAATHGGPGGSCASPSRTAGNTVAKEAAAKRPPAHGLGDILLYHQLGRRRFTLSPPPQTVTLP